MSFPSRLVRKALFPLIAISLMLVLSACAPHPGSGNWQATDDNRYGIEKISVLFDGKAEFSTTTPDNADMHCFWGASGKSTVALQCTASTNPDREESYQLTVGDDGVAEFSHGGSVIGRFSKAAMQ